MMATRIAAWKPFAIAILLLLFASLADAQIIDPEKYIKQSGTQTSRAGNDGKTIFHSYTERANTQRIASFEKGIESLPKRVEVFQLCDQMRGSVKAQLIKDTGRSMDVAAVNYGHSGSTIACTLKYMHETEVGTQLVFMKKAQGAMYMVFVTD